MGAVRLQPPPPIPVGVLGFRQEAGGGKKKERKKWGSKSDSNPRTRSGTSNSIQTYQFLSCSKACLSHSHRVSPPPCLGITPHPAQRGHAGFTLGTPRSEAGSDCVDGTQLTPDSHRGQNFAWHE
ncbi:hypothetical protein KIL84_004180 [Mauremys mutica]|uniref:Uncharacterized protein n=1 Tax=Mauremys mutica TaxID=74926 RepID=A0A9D3XMK0_9SAUR|nr:hypothetical protein KIL84_004180 [Mauremys mutica]